MNKLKLLCFISVLLALVALSPPSSAQSKRARKFVVSYDRIGPVKIGMTRSQASKALGVRVTRDIGYEGGNCYYTSPKRGFKDIAFMMSGKRIARIDINGTDYATDRGAKVGDTEATIKRLYKGRIRESRHPYVDYGHYLVIEIKGGKYGIIFETDGKRVTSFRAGKYPAVGYIEGCS